MTFNEMQLCKTKGLCFNYDKKYTPAHICKNRRLLLLQWEKETSAETVDETEFLAAIDTPSDDNSPKHSLNVMNSAPVSGTMGFIRSINGYVVVVLLDRGSDDSFIQPRIANFLKLDVSPTNPFKVLVGDGNSL